MSINVKLFEILAKASRKQKEQMKNMSYKANGQHELKSKCLVVIKREVQGEPIKFAEL